MCIFPLFVGGSFFVGSGIYKVGIGRRHRVPRGFLCFSGGRGVALVLHLCNLHSESFHILLPLEGIHRVSKQYCFTRGSLSFFYGTIGGYGEVDVVGGKFRKKCGS